MKVRRRTLFRRNRTALTLLYHCLRLMPTLRDAGTAAGQTCDHLVSDKYRWIYIGVPLTGTRSMLGALVRRRNADEYGIRMIKGIPASVIADLRHQGDYRVFSFVRNPWSRVVSCYNKKILNCNNLTKLYFASRYGGLRPMMAFRDFISWLATEEGSDARADPHWLSQWRFLHDADGQPLCDRIGRLESFREDLSEVFEAYDTPPLDLEHKRGSQHMAVAPMFTNYRDYYDDSSRDLIGQRYRKDVEMFDYTF